MYIFSGIQTFRSFTVVTVMILNSQTDMSYANIVDPVQAAPEGSLTKVYTA